MANNVPMTEDMGQRGYIIYSTLKKRYEVVMEYIGKVIIPPRSIVLEVMSK